MINTAKYRNRQAGYVVEVWLNRPGAEIPNWLQGRGAGRAGEVIHYLCELVPRTEDDPLPAHSVVRKAHAYDYLIRIETEEDRPDYISSNSPWYFHETWEPVGEPLPDARELLQRSD